MTGEPMTNPAPPVPPEVLHPWCSRIAEAFSLIEHRIEGDRDALLVEFTLRSLHLDQSDTGAAIRARLAGQPNDDKSKEHDMTNINGEEEADWYFTFAANHTHPDTGLPLGNAYVKVHGTEASARLAIGALFGSQWSMQYSSAEAAGVDRFNLTEVDLPMPGF